jgi:mannose-6-phosphate isomerase-like protein (cupin superfamily)
MPVTLKSPLTKYEVTILKSAQETDGAYSLLRVDLFPQGGNEMHYHTKFSEHFQVVTGILSVQIGKKVHQFRKGESYTVHPPVPHRFFNEFSTTAVLNVQ